MRSDRARPQYSSLGASKGRVAKLRFSLTPWDMSICDFHGVGRGEKCQDDYDWKINIDGSGVLDMVKTFLYRLLCGHGCKT